MKEVVALLDALESRGRLKGNQDRCVIVMLGWCELLRHLLSPTLSGALDLAHRYWRREATREELDQARVACWRDLDAMDLRFRYDDPRYLAGRAVICVLFPDFPDEGESEGGHMYLCLEFANRAEGHSAEQKDVLLRAFGAALCN